MIIKKTYAGSQTRQLLPKDGNIGGVIGDSKATTLQFKFPKEYDLGGIWQRYIEFDCYILDEHGNEIQPRYPLTTNEFVIPADIAVGYEGKTVNYNLVFIKDGGATVEKSEQATIFFRNSANGTYPFDPRPREDWVQELYEKALGRVRITTNNDDRNPITLHYDGIAGGEVQDPISYPIPFLISGKIPEKFLSSNFIVSVYKINSVDELTSLKKAEPPDLALVIDGASKDDLYMLVQDDYSNPDNWLPIHTNNPVFDTVTSQHLDVVGNTTLNNVEITNKITTNLGGALLVTNDVGVVEKSNISIQELENLADSRGNIQLQLDNKTEIVQAIPNWDKDTIYNLTSTVLYGNTIYISLVENNKGVVPSTDKDKWKMIQGSGGGSGEEPTTFTTQIGDGENTKYTIAHGLNTLNVFTAVRDDAGNYVEAVIRAVSKNEVEVEFTKPPTPESPRIVIISPGAYGKSTGGGEGGWMGYSKTFSNQKIWTIFRSEIADAPDRMLVVQTFDEMKQSINGLVEQTNKKIEIKFNEVTTGTVVLT